MASATVAAAPPAAMPAPTPTVNATISNEKAVAQKFMLWRPNADKRSTGKPSEASITTPQVSVFDAAGAMIYHGSVLDAMAWIDAGAPKTAIPAKVQARSWKALTTDLSLPATAKSMQMAVYVSGDCSPCNNHFAQLQLQAAKKPNTPVQFQVVRVKFPE